MSASAPSAPRVYDASALPVGTRLGEFELLSLLGVGGFGIVYLAFDHALEREVAVKEYMPASLAGRTETMHVSLRSQSDADTFALGLRSFVNEARLLARFDHPSLLKVLRFWEANGTAYMAMPVMRGRTLKELRVELGHAPDETTLRSMLDALLGALERLHGEGVYHRDIAPDNIQIEPDGRPVLLDFGAARRVLTDKTQTLTAILKPAYAPIEQYAETGSVKQGPWTDFYALGATLHFVLVGRPPAPATARAVFDDSAALAEQSLPGFSPAFLQLVDWMLAPKPADRPQSVAELRQVLRGERQVPQAFQVVPSTDAWDKTQVLPRGLTGGDDATLVMPRTQALADEVRSVSAPGSARGVAAAAGVLPAGPGSMTAAAPPALANAPVAPIVTQLAAVAVTPAAPRKAAWPMAVAGLAALAVAGFLFWPKSTTTGLGASASGGAPAAAVDSITTPAGGDTAATAATAAALSPGAAGASTAASPVTGDPAATVTPSTLPAQASTSPAAATSLAARAVPESEIKPAGPAFPATTRPAPRQAVETVANKPGSPTAPNRVAPATSAVPQTPVSAAPAPSVIAPATGATAAPPAGATAAAAPSSVARPATDAPTLPAAAAGPEAKCGGRNPLSYFVCMERECLRSNFSGHADCQAWRKDAKRE